MVVLGPERLRCRKNTVENCSGIGEDRVSEMTSDHDTLRRINDQRADPPEGDFLCDACEEGFREIDLMPCRHCQKWYCEEHFDGHDCEGDEDVDSEDD